MRYLPLYFSCLLLLGCPNDGNSNIERSSYPGAGTGTGTGTGNDIFLPDYIIRIHLNPAGLSLDGNQMRQVTYLDLTYLAEFSDHSH